MKRQGLQTSKVKVIFSLRVPVRGEEGGEGDKEGEEAGPGRPGPRQGSQSRQRPWAGPWTEPRQRETQQPECQPHMARRVAEHPRQQHHRQGGRRGERQPEQVEKVGLVSDHLAQLPRLLGDHHEAEEGGSTGSGTGGRRDLNTRGFVCNIIFLNVRSVLSKIDQLNILVNDKKPCVLCITETWCNQSISNAMLNLPNYVIDDELRMDRTDMAGGIGGGLLVYVRSDVTVKALPCISEFNQYCKFQLLSFVANDPLDITLVYRSPNSSMENTAELAKLIENCGNKCLFISDLNLPNMCVENGT